MNFKRVLAILLAVLMTVSLCACGGNPDTSTDGNPSGGSDSISNPDRDAKIKAEPNEITFITIGYDGKTESSPYYKAVQDMKNLYGKTVTLIQASGEETWNQKVAAQVAAQDPIDVFYFNDQTFLNMYLKGYMAPVNDYIDLTQPWHQLSIMDDYMKFDGKYYGGRITATPYVMYYNRDLLINNGYSADYPQELYQNGEWNWDKFVEICRECTDTETGIVGLQNMYDEVFEASNACRIVEFEDGQYKLNIKSAATRKTLELVQDIFKNNPICGIGYTKGQSQFLMGRSVFHGAFAYEEAVFTEMKNAGDISMDFGVVPFPYGPSNTDKKNYGDASGFAISSGTDAPYTAGMFIDLIGKYQHEEETAKNDLLQPGSKELYEELGKNLFFPNYTSGVLEQGEGAFYLLYYVRTGADINKEVAKYETYYQKMIDDANKELRKD